MLHISSKLRREMLGVVLASMPLLWVAVANGFPMFFADSGAYLRIGTELHFTTDRPVTYGLAVAPLHWVGGLWAVVIAQALFSVFLIRRALLEVIDCVSTLRLVGITTLLTLTSLPWFVGQIMPDLFTGLLPLALFVLVRGGTYMGRTERVVWVCLVAVLITLHLTHVMIAAAVCGVILVYEYAFGTIRRILAGLTLAALSLVLAIVGMSSLNLLGAGVFKPSLMSSTFLFARLLDDGIAQPVLEEVCLREKRYICAVKTFVDRPGLSLPGLAYIWEEQSPRAGLSGAEAERLGREESLIVKEAVLTRPLVILQFAFSSWGRQLLSAKTGDGLTPLNSETQVWRQIHEHFPASVPAWEASRQQRGKLQQLALPSLGPNLVLLAVLLFLVFKLRDHRVGAFATTLINALLVNAAVCGILSGVFDRYQSRVIWLLPLAAIAGLIALTRTGWHQPAGNS